MTILCHPAQGRLGDRDAGSRAVQGNPGFPLSRE